MAAPAGTSASSAAPSSGSSGTVRETRGAAGVPIGSIGGSPAGSEVIAQQDTTRDGRRLDIDGRMARMSRASLDKDPRDVAAMFDDVASKYDVTNDVLSLGQDRLWRRAVVQACEAVPGQVVLDIAAGTGTSSEPFADSGVDVVPADFSLGMLRVGHRRRSDLGFTAADAMNLPFADESFDVVTMSFGLRNVADPDAALREFLRVTKPGGRFVLCEFSQPTNKAFRTVYSKYLMRSLPAVARKVSSNPESYVYLAESIQAWPAQRAMAQRIADAGWEGVKWRNLSGGDRRAAPGHEAARDRPLKVRPS